SPSRQARRPARAFTETKSAESRLARPTDRLRSAQPIVAVFLFEVRDISMKGLRMSEFEINPALVHWNGHEGLPRFDLVKDEDFAAAFDIALARHDAEIEAIAQDREEPSLRNTIVPLEIAGD